MKKMHPPVNRDNCGKVLREIRQKFGSMSMAELAKILGVSRSTVMRIEAGKTLPSEELLNRLKAVQLIGISKFRELSQKDSDHFTMFMKGIGENAENFSNNMSTMVEELTPSGILAGLGTIASASLNMSTSVVSAVPVLSSLAGYGLVKGLKGILEANDLNCTEKDGVWEITTKGEQNKGFKQEVTNMDEKKSGVDGNFGLGGLFKGLGDLIEAASKLAEKGEGISKSGEIDFSGLDKIKGLQDLKGVYGVRVRTMADGRPSVQPFGNIKKTAKKSTKGPVVEEVREPIIDIFDESEEISVVAEMPGIDEKEVQIEIKGDILNITAEGKTRKYQKEVLLSREATTENMTWSYKNGMLEIKIPKGDN